MNEQDDGGNAVRSRPVFIVGMNGSGTTMVLDHLDHHPDLFGFRLETYVLPHYLHNQERYGDLTQDANFLKLWNKMRSEYPIRRVNKGKALDIPRDWEEVPRSVAGIFDRIMREFAARDGKQRWCEKTPMYALHIGLLSKAFPHARFIHMIRDGRDCAASNVRRWGRDPQGTIYRWKKVITEGRDQGAALPDRYLELKYEDLTGNPQRHMREICQFLGVDFDSRVLSTGRSRPHMAGLRSKKIIKKQRPSYKILSESTIRSLEQIAGEQLADLGYTTDFTEGDLTPSLPRRIWWFASDTVNVLSRQIRRKLTVQRHMTWSLFLARLKAMIRQAANLPSNK